MASTSDPTTLPQTIPQTESFSQNISSSSMADESANNPYFLPVAENPGIILSSQPLIGPENYADWTRSVFLALSARNKFAFVNGTISKPEVTSPLYNSWCRCNTMVLSWLVNSLCKDLQASVRYINTARELWIDLRDRFSQGSSPRLYELQKEISHLTQGQLSVSSYFTKFKTLWDEFASYQSYATCTCVCTCCFDKTQVETQQKKHVFRFLMD